MPMIGKLFVCATPIGNLGDASPRLLKVLSEVDAIAAEDTRRTGKLLSHFGIKTRLISYHEINESSRARELVEKMRGGAVLALVSDGGMPLISDPGYRVVRAAIDAGLRVEVIPGPSSITAALVVSGLPSARFVFEGFLPRKAGDLKRRLESLVDEERTIVFFEATNRIVATLTAIRDVVGERPAAVARELTKIYEEVIRGTLSEIIGQVEESPPKGEAVIILGGREGAESKLEQAVQRARALVEKGATKSKAAGSAASQFDVKRRDIYERLLD